MKKIIILFIYGTLPFTNGSILSKRLFVPDTKIIGGTDAPDGGIPYQVSLRNGINHFCGAALLNSRWVVTAAHCTIEFPASDIVVVTGTNSVVYGGEKYSVEKVVIHEDYNETTIINDISLVKVTEDIKFGERVKAIDLPNSACQPGSNVLLTGWGRKTSGDDPIPMKLQMVNQTVMSTEHCQYMFRDVNVVTENQLCTMTQSVAGACQGDSGGPLANNNKLVGIVSWGVDCDLFFPDVNTDVWHYTSWVKDKMAHN